MKTLCILAPLAMFLLTAATPENGHHVKADLVPAAGSSVGGFVQITSIAQGGSNVHVKIRGLEPGETYAVFYYEGTDCAAPADIIGAAFSAPATGQTELSAKIDDDLPAIGSISVRVGPDYGSLRSCARLH